ncbi:hypothetical protein AMTR_s00139p00081730 [Amborella trichopoda]|uniref:Aminotransferase-like plant mobile domain-containing protein n=1 Tax=Amborella trichopoda TaxID=13333 RepID=W1NEQ2_AMBTC|nr:hypothetical protein AMTR_s00139p00081730 [Amborella trichopoda]
MTPSPTLSLYIYIYIYIFVGFFVDCRSPLFAIRKWAALLTPGQRQALAQIGFWEIYRIRPFSLDRALIMELSLRYRSETCSILLRCSEVAPTLADVTRILGARSEGESFLSIPPGMSTSYASDYKELFGIPFEKIKGRHDSEIHLGKLRWEFTGVPHCAERMIGGRAPPISIFLGRRPSRWGKGLMEEDGVGGMQREFGRDTPYLSDGSTFFDEDTVPPQCGKRSPLLGELFDLSPGLGLEAHHPSSSSSRSTGTIIPDNSLLVIWNIEWTPMRVEPIPATYVTSSQAFRTTVHLICMLLVMPTFLGEVHRQLSLPQTSCEITLP